MTKAAVVDLEPRKTPRQDRSVATVQAIYDATIQVLHKNGPDRLTTVRVAERAGVSVGTLYQYFPNKRALLLAVLERHLERMAKTVEDTCANNHFQPLEEMVDELVNRFIDAKLAERETATALYRIAAEQGGDAIVDRIRKRCEGALLAMLQTARLPANADLKYMTHMIYLTMAGTLRGHLEGNATPKMTKLLREHLPKLVLSYCRAVGR